MQSMAAAVPNNNPYVSTKPSEYPNAKPFSAIPGDNGLPLLGNTIPMLTKPIEFLDSWYNKYGPVARTKAIGQNMLLLLGPEMNRAVLLDPDGIISSREGLRLFMEPFFSEGLVLKDGMEHSMHRGIMRAAFRPSKLAGYLAAMNPILERNLATWFPAGSDRANIKFFDRFKKAALDIATVIFMGAEVGPEGDRLIQAFQNIVAASVAVIRAPLPGTSYWRGLKSRKLLEKYFYSKIGKKRANPGSDLFSELCVAKSDEGDRFTDEDIVNHMIFLMMAAHDTTTFTTTRMVYHLAKHPEWQERLREQSRALGRAQVTADDLPALSDIELVMKESLRLMAPVPGLPRRTIKDAVLHGYFVPAGTLIQIDMRHTHYMNEYWPEPHKFDPTRYDHEGDENLIHKYAWVPFGGGAHKCIGRHFAEHQIKAALHQMLLTMRWSVPSNYVQPISFPGLPMPKDHFPLTIERL